MMPRLVQFALTVLVTLAVAVPDRALPAPLFEGTVTAAEAREEIEFVHSVLVGLHPGVDRYTPPGQLEHVVAQVKNGIGDRRVGIDRLYLELSRITAAVCDEHTFVHYPVENIDDIDEDARPPGFHEPLLFVDGTPYLDAGEAAGLQVVDIDGVPGHRLYEELVERMSVDGCARTRRVLQSGHQGLELLAARLGGRPEYVIRLREASGRERELAVRARALGPVLADLHGPERNGHTALDALGFRTVSDDGEIRYALNSGDDIGYIHLQNLKIEDEDALRRVMRRMIADNPADLIVDFQGNPGGLNTTTSLFLSFLLQRAHGFTGRYHVRVLDIPRKQHFVWGKEGEQEFRNDMRQFRRAGKRGRFYTLRGRVRAFGNPDYDGRITVLIDPATGSAAGAAATILKTYRDVRIVGTQAHAGGAHFCFRPRGFYRLPHSRLLVAVPHMCATRSGAVAERFEYAVEPDLFVDMTAAALGDLRGHIIRTAVDDILGRREPEASVMAPN